MYCHTIITSEAAVIDRLKGWVCLATAMGDA